jgi:putative transcriptional regulator
MSIDRLLQIRTNNLAPSKGKVLISEPLMGDYYFGRSVVLLAEHNEEGSFGLIMNKPLSSSFNEVVKGFPDFDATIYLGGPVQTDSLFFVHILGNEIPESNEIIDGLYWGGNLETVREMILLHALKPGQIRFYIGYSGWDANQLEAELKRNSWLVSTANANSLMHTRPEKMWDRFLRVLLFRQKDQNHQRRQLPTRS